MREVVINLVLPNVFRHVGRAARHGTTDVIMEDIDTAKLVHAGTNEGLYFLGFRDVCDMSDACAAGIGDQFLGLCSGIEVDVRGKDLRAFLSKPHRRGLAVPPTRTN